MRTLRLGPSDVPLARATFALVQEVFGVGGEPLSGAHLQRLLRREEFWALAAVVDGVPVGGLTAHVLPMTRAEVDELFVYDLAVRADWQRRGVGRALVRHLLRAASAAGAVAPIGEVFVLADDEDVHALDFYRAVGGVAQPVTMFSFAPEPAGGGPAGAGASSG
ncbi:GNAT family N-acetyltransferase [Kineococcus indalonis]|uniref:GNAT family N-acetyltransferase n=1 Tax=Kineococcus indalonis TaxID=2696566 RepID=UPI00141361B8|nr:GNAT family N-acetyltransferase [Kineococcus indalonis]NAZ87187.1 GNAT family N-acetyltransferase [Kineococcus indalonis]